MEIPLPLQQHLEEAVAAAHARYSRFKGVFVIRDGKESYRAFPVYDSYDESEPWEDSPSQDCPHTYYTLGCRLYLSSLLTPFSHPLSIGGLVHFADAGQLRQRAREYSLTPESFIGHHASRAKLASLLSTGPGDADR